MQTFDIFLIAFANENTAFIAEKWAADAQVELQPNLVMANLINRNWENQLSADGQTVNVPTVGKFTAGRKSDGDDIVIQDAKAGTFPVVLNQHIYASVALNDVEISKAYVDLKSTYMTPLVQAVASQIDACIHGMASRFAANQIGSLTTAADRKTIIAARTAMNRKNVPLNGRYMVLSPGMEGSLLTDLNLTAQNVAGGNEITTGLLGSKFGFNFFMSQSTPSIEGITYRTFKINLAAGYAKGYAGAIVVDTGTGTVDTGAVVVIGGHYYFVTAHTETSGATTGITLDRGLDDKVADNDEVSVCPVGTMTAAKDAGYDKEFAVTNGITKAGLITTIGGKPYGQILGATTGNLLNIGLEADAAAGATVGYGPNGGFGFAFHRDAITMVNRPLAKPDAGTGVVSAVSSYNGISLRVTKGYDQIKQRHIITVDTLCGFAVSRKDAGFPVLSDS